MAARCYTAFELVIIEGARCHRIAQAECRRARRRAVYRLNHKDTVLHGAGAGTTEIGDRQSCRTSCRAAGNDEFVGSR